MKFHPKYSSHESKMRRREIRKKVFRLFLKTIETDRQKTNFLICYLINQRI